jgi:MscS family membrane protein
LTWLASTQQPGENGDPNVSFDDVLPILNDVWSRGVLGFTVGEVMTTAFILFIAFVVRGLFSRFVVQSLKRMARASASRADDALIEALSQPVKLIPIMIGLYAAGQIMHLGPAAAEILDKALQSMIAFAIFWAASRAIASFRFALEPLEAALNKVIVDWLTRFLQGFFLFVGIAAVLELWGIAVAPILAGLGVFGVALALGAQDLFKNLIAGLLILAEKRFAPGEWIQVDGVVEGTVESIGFRSTVVRRFDKGPVYVPNSKLADNPVVNFTRMTHRRIFWKIGLEYASSHDQLRVIRERIEAWLVAHEGFARPPEAHLFVRLDAFSASSIDIMVYCFTRTTVWGEWLSLKEELALAIKQIVESEGASFAFPSQSVYLAGEGLPDLYLPSGEIRSAQSPRSD